MKKKAFTVLSLLLCLCLLLPGCGGGGEETLPPQETTTAPVSGGIEIAGTAWTYEDVIFAFFDDGSMLAGGDVGTYTWDGTTGSGYASIQDFTMEMLTKDGSLLMEGEDGAFYPLSPLGEMGDMEEGHMPVGGSEHLLYGTWVYAEDQDTYLYFDEDGMVEISAFSSSDRAYHSYSYDGVVLFIYDDGATPLTSGYLDSDGDLNLEGMASYFELQDEENWTLEYNEDDTVTFTDYDRNVSFQCPTWMTIGTDGIGENTDAVIVTDNAGGYVIGDNVTNEWNAYSGSDWDYLQEYIDAYLPEFVLPLYGQWEDSDHLELALEEDHWLAVYELNLWNDDWDIGVLVLMYRTTDDNIMVKTFIYPYMEDEQFNTLWTQVTHMTNP